MDVRWSFDVFFDFVAFDGTFLSLGRLIYASVGTCLRIGRVWNRNHTCCVMEMVLGLRFDKICNSCKRYD